MELNLDDIITGLPAAVVIALYLFIRYWNDFTGAIRRLYSDRQADYTDRREASQHLQESRLDFELQTQAAREAQEYYHSTIIIDILKDQLRFSREDMSEIQQLLISYKQEIIKVNSRIQGIQMILSQVDDRLKAIETVLSKIL